MAEVMTIGETMVMFSPAHSGPLRYVHDFRKRMAGAESNVAIGLARLGHSCCWVSRVGDDEFGHYLIKELRGEGVDVSQVKIDPQAPTGIMFKEISEGRDTRVYYYRKGSAASRMTPEDLKPESFAGLKILHITGITPALSESCRQTLLRAVEIARSYGSLISFDPNIRLKLWDRKRASEVLREIVPLADIVLCGLDEGEILYGTGNAEQLMDTLLDAGVKTVAVKLGAQGSWLAQKDSRIRMEAFPVNRVIDPVGAGDAYASGFLTGVLEGGSLMECGKLASAMGALAVTGAGDFECLPCRSELDDFISGKTGILR